MAKKTEEVEILTLEVIEVIETQINESFVKENITDAVIAKLKEDYLPLKINGLKDKKGYLIVQEARKNCKALRVSAKKICEAGRAESNAKSRKWIERQNDVVGRIAEVENYLEKQENDWEAENERVETARRQAMESRYATRIQELTGFGASLQDGFWKLEDSAFEMALVKEGDEDIYSDIREAFKAKFDVKEQVRIAREEKERKERAELEKLRNQRRGMRIDVLKGKGMTLAGPDFLFMEGFGMHFNDTHMRMLLDEDSDYWEESIVKIDEKIAAFKKEEEEQAAIKQMERQIAERNKDRQSSLLDLGLRWDGADKHFRGHGVAVHISNMEGEDHDTWERTFKQLSEFVAINKENAEREGKQKRNLEIKDAADQAMGISRLKSLQEVKGESDLTALESGRLTEEEWAAIYLKARKEFDFRQQQAKDKKEEERKEQERLQKEKELSESSDKEKYQHVIDCLMAIPLPDMKSGVYRGKMRIVKDFIDQFK